MPSNWAISIVIFFSLFIFHEPHQWRCKRTVFFPFFSPSFPSYNSQLFNKKKNRDIVVNNLFCSRLSLHFLRWILVFNWIGVWNINNILVSKVSKWKNECLSTICMLAISRCCSLIWSNLCIHPKISSAFSEIWSHVISIRELIII